MPIIEPSTTGCTAPESMRSYVHRRQTTHTPPKPTMSQIAALQNEVINLQQTMQTIQTAMDAINSKIKTLTEAEEFDVFMLNEMTPFFGEDTSRHIVKVLQKCRTEDHNYLHFSPVYQWKGIKGDLEKRQLLKLISATYRVKYSRNVPLVYSLRSEIKYAKACPHCGALASAFYDRLVKEGKI